METYTTSKYIFSDNGDGDPRLVLLDQLFEKLNSVQKMEQIISFLEDPKFFTVNSGKELIPCIDGLGRLCEDKDFLSELMVRVYKTISEYVIEKVRVDKNNASELLSYIVSVVLSRWEWNFSLLTHKGYGIQASENAKKFFSFICDVYKSKGDFHHSLKKRIIDFFGDKGKHNFNANPESFVGLITDPMTPFEIIEVLLALRLRMGGSYLAVKELKELQELREELRVSNNSELS